MKAAFDEVKRSEIWRIMKEKGIDQRMIERIEKIYRKTEGIIMIGDKELEKKVIKRGVSQGCPLSTLLFNIVMSDLEKKMKKAQERGVMIGKRKVWSISYADDVALMAYSEEGMREVLKRLKKYMEKIGLELNVKKSKMMISGEKRGRGKEQEFKWKGEKKENVKEFTYLEYRMKDNNKEEN